MKRACLLPFLFLLCLFSFLNTKAQNWQPVIKGYTYNYLLDNQQLPVYSVKVDSTNANTAGDSVYFLNKVYNKCESCTSLGRTTIDSENYITFQKFYLNQSQFLLKEITYNGIGNFSFSLAPNAGFEIWPNNINSSWQFDKKNNITANISAINDTIIFGNTDSIMHISLSSGDEILLSRNNGILQFPYNYGSNKYYKLAGINEKKAGVILPGFSDIFNFEIGDKFEYHDTTGSKTYYTTSIWQYTITSKLSTPDSIIYGYDGYIRDTANGRAISGTLRYFKASHEVLNQTYHSIINKKNVFALKKYPQYDTIGIGYNSTYNTYTKIYNQYNANTLIKPYHDSDIMLNIMLSTDDYDKLTEYGTGLGVISYLNTTIAWGETSTLVAHKNSKRTIGTFTPVEKLLSIDENNPAVVTWQIFPNPATNVIKIATTGAKSRNFSYQLCNLQGQEILTANEKGSKAEINIEHLPKGIYLLKIQDNTQTITRKIIKN